ncbi:MAG: HypC/HybG/HupF family hydrogenase formation chaperone [Leptonema illini]|uniref:HypC/HybG/HupF family hydrogenase formation chaperone n=1 Tax=Leptonema illini TaxID=183 RepID=A0A833LWA4_9LEPT|nr:MAG: HypC/HybG/HupF family hydrogenase formation chaperone [Leptonema illini]
MCLAIPMQIRSVNGFSGEAEVTGVTRTVDLSLVTPVAVGDYVLVHTGFAIQKIDEEEFEKTLAILNEIADVMDELRTEER